MKPVILDANAIIRFLDSYHQGHQESARTLNRISNPLIIHDLTLSECLIAAVRVGNDTEALRVITTDLGAETYGEVGIDWVKFLTHVRANSRPALTIPDAVVLATAMRLDGLVLTFDERLKAAARNAGVLYNPPN